MSREGVGREQKARNGGRGWGGKEKPASEPIHFTKRRSSTNGRQLGITIGQSRVNQNSECQQLLNRWITDRSISELSAGSNLAVFEDTSFEFALQETAEVFSPSKKSINLNPEPVAAVKSLLCDGKDVLAVLQTGFGKSAIFQFFLRVKECMSRDSACILVIYPCPLRSFWQGLTANSLPEVSLEDLRAGKFQLLLSSAENVLGNEFLAFFLKQDTIFHGGLAAVVVDESHRVETWSGKSAINNLSELLQ